MNDNTKGIGPIIEEENFENDDEVSTDRVLENGTEPNSEDHNKNIIQANERNGCAGAQSNGHAVSSNGKTEKPREVQKKKSTDNLSTSSLFDSKRYLQLETLNKKGGSVKFKNTNKVQSSTCVIL